MLHLLLATITSWSGTMLKLNHFVHLHYASLQLSYVIIVKKFAIPLQKLFPKRRKYPRVHFVSNVIRNLRAPRPLCPLLATPMARSWPYFCVSWYCLTTSAVLSVFPTMLPRTIVIVTVVWPWPTIFTIGMHVTWFSANPQFSLHTHCGFAVAWSADSTLAS